MSATSYVHLDVADTCTFRTAACFVQLRQLKDSVPHVWTDEGNDVKERVLFFGMTLAQKCAQRCLSYVFVLQIVASDVF